MPARTGEQFLRGLKDDREVWLGGEKTRTAGGSYARTDLTARRHRPLSLRGGEADEASLVTPCAHGMEIAASASPPRNDRAACRVRRIVLEIAPAENRRKHEDRGRDAAGRCRLAHVLLPQGHHRRRHHRLVGVQRKLRLASACPT